MIVKMKKVTLLVWAKRTNIAVHELRKLGLMHIKHMRTPQADYITSIESKISKIDKALKITNDFVSKKEAESKVCSEPVKSRNLSEYIRK